MRPTLAHGLRPGDAVRVAFAKWGGGPHWSGDCVWLGEDEHGRWAGWGEGTVWMRPGASFVSHGRQVGLFPRDRGFAATFYEPVAAVDLDLDVIQRFDGTCFVDDEDEFAEHQVSLGYPAEVVVAAEAECDRLVVELTSHTLHFAEPLAAHWRHELTHLAT